MFVEALKALDRSTLYETIFNSTEASLALSPYIYSEIVYQLGFRQMILDKIYSEDFTIYGNLYNTLDYLNHTDCRLLFLMAILRINVGNICQCPENRTAISGISSSM